MKDYKTLFLICSLIFNFAFFGIFVYREFRGPLPPPPPGEEFKQANPEARRFFEKFKNETMPCRVDYKTSRREFMEYLGNDDFSEEKAYRMLDELTEKQKVLEEKLGKQMIVMRKDFGSQKFRQILRHHRDRELKYHNFK